MKNYEQKPPTTSCPFPKPARVKRLKKGAWRRAKVSKRKDGKLSIEPAHDDILNACIDAAEAMGYHWKHVPNTLYRLIAMPRQNREGGYDPLAFALQNALGQGPAMAIKAELAMAYKGVVDLCVVASIGNGLNLTLEGDIKRGPDKLNAAQRRYSKEVSIREWRSVDEFMLSLREFHESVGRVRSALGF